jgi:hypothetical protein
VCSISLQSDRDVATLLKMAGLRDMSANSLGKRRAHMARSMLRISRQIIQLLPPGNMRLVGATDTWGRRPGIRAVKTTPSSFSLLV